MIYLFIGRRELGKTTLAYSMLKKLSKRAAIDMRSTINQHDPRIETTHNFSDTREALFAMVDGRSVNEVIYQPDEEDTEAVFDAWCRTLKAIVIEDRRRELGVLVDEASFFRLDSKPFQWLAKCAKREFCHLLITAHQPKDFPTNIRALADHWFIFRTTQQTDLDKIAEKSPQVADIARTLDGRSYVHWNDTIAEGRIEINRAPASWFVELETAQSRPQEIDDDADRSTDRESADAER